VAIARILAAVRTSTVTYLNGNRRNSQPINNNVSPPDSNNKSDGMIIASLKVQSRLGSEHKKQPVAELAII